MRFTKVLAATAAALVLAASGCSSGGNTDSQSSQSEDSQSGDGPAGVVSEEGMEAVHALGSCEDIGELLEGSVPGLLDGMELVVNDAGADKPTICDWQGDDSLIAVEASPYEQLVPDADDIEVAGGVEVEATKFAEAGARYTLSGKNPRPLSVWFLTGGLLFSTQAWATRWTRKLQRALLRGC